MLTAAGRSVCSPQDNTCLTEGLERILGPLRGVTLIEKPRKYIPRIKEATASGVSGWKSPLICLRFPSLVEGRLQVRVLHVQGARQPPCSPDSSPGSQVAGGPGRGRRLCQQWAGWD